MDRRKFLALLAATAAGAVLDPERLLWVPGRKTFFLPPEPFSVSFSGADLFLDETDYRARYIMPLVQAMVRKIDEQALDALPCRLDTLYGWGMLRPEKRTWLRS